MVRGAKKEKAETERRSSSKEMAPKVVPEEECVGPFPKPIARLPRWMKEVSTSVSKPGHETVMHSGAPLAKTYKEAAVKMVPEGRKVPGENTTEVASGVRCLERGSASNSDPKKLMGRDEVGQGYFDAFSELLNVKETLCKLREEVDVVLRRTEGAIKYVGLGGMGLEARSPCITQVSNQKGKEAAGVGGKRLRSLRGFKPKKKVMVWKPKSEMGLGLGQGFTGSESYMRASWVGNPGASTLAVAEGHARNLWSESRQAERDHLLRRGGCPRRWSGRLVRLPAVWDHQARIPVGVGSLLKG